jgi:haloalkane dehalogenase
MKDRKPMWRWPNEIPIDGKPADVTNIVQAYNRKLSESDCPKLMFFAHPGGIMKEPLVKWCQENLKNLKTVDIGNGIHYLQEDNPKMIGTELLNWYKSL